MFQTARVRKLTGAGIKQYEQFLYEQEKSQATIQKYVHDLRAAERYFDGADLTKSLLIEWKYHLSEKYVATSVNTILAAINGFMKYMGWNDLVVKLLKIQRRTFCEENKELTKKEYERLVHAAKENGNQRLSLVIQTICATGIRVSELKSITVEAIRKGRAEVKNKGKQRTVILPNKLRRILGSYIKSRGIMRGSVFVTKSGAPLDRSNIWRDMKALCQSAGVEASKVFPHNLRHLFARTYYSVERDISRLADILGHTNINTTRIYTIESGAIHAKQLERLNFIIT